MKKIKYEPIFFLKEERLAAAAGALTPLQIVLDETIEYTRSRIAFGKPLLDNQYIHFRLAELQTELDLVRSMLYMAADSYLQGQNVTLLASMLKLKTGRLAREVTDSCLQFWGGKKIATYLLKANHAKNTTDHLLLVN